MNRLTIKHGADIYSLVNPIDFIDNDYSRVNYKRLTTHLGRLEDELEQFYALGTLEEFKTLKEKCEQERMLLHE